jgi:predicted transport protein
MLDELYAGAKAHLRPIHEKLMAAVAKLGPFEIAPKKGYVSLRRKKQFATVGPATKTRVDVGLNMKGLQATERLTELPAGSMCQYRVSLMDAKEVDGELMAWIKQAYESAG